MKPYLQKKALLCQPVQQKNTLLFAEDQVTTADSKGNLEMGVFALQNIANNFGAEISSKNRR
jgi:hypothetical protein